MYNQSQINSLIKCHFEKKGYTVIKNSVKKSVVKNLLNNIKINIQKCAQDIGIPVTKYLSVVSRWGDPSPVTDKIFSEVKENICSVVKQVCDNEVVFIKSNLICKNRYTSGSVPYHQDISYSPHSPYQISAWLALNDVDEKASPLEVIEGSHKQKVESAVDFWAPDFISCLPTGTKLPVMAGDIILFDSRLWHGSSQSHSLLDRYALVARWSEVGFTAKQEVPEIRPAPFGMWTCGQKTQHLLMKGKKYIFENSAETFLFEDLIEFWTSSLPHINLPFDVSISDAIDALQKVRILHLAHLQHNGGDATGTIYKNLWKVLLKPLEQYLCEMSNSDD
jgi:hypothetical protein